MAVFRKLRVARSLFSSMAVYKRFRSIAPMVDEVFLPIPLKKLGFDPEHRGFFRNLVMKPLNFISRLVKFKLKNEENDLDFYSNYVPNQILKPFDKIRGLHPETLEGKTLHYSSMRSLEAAVFLPPARGFIL